MIYDLLRLLFDPVECAAIQDNVAEMLVPEARLITIN